MNKANWAQADQRARPSKQVPGQERAKLNALPRKQAITEAKGRETILKTNMSYYLLDDIGLFMEISK